MTTKKTSASFASHIQRVMLTGIFTLIPLWITWIVFSFMVEQLSKLGQPVFQLLYEAYGQQIIWLEAPWFQAALSVVLTLIFLYLVGLTATRIVGRRMIGLFERTIERLPLVEKIYGAVKTLMSSLQQKPDGVQRVVLIEFPSRHMKTVGFVTRTLTDEDTGEQIAAVYVPTTPNPTSGYLELVPLDQLTSTDWSVDEAMSFIMSGGAVSRETVNYRRSAGDPITLEEATKVDPSLVKDKEDAV